MEDQGVIADYLDELKTNTIILAKIKNAKVKKVLDGRKNKAVAAKEQYIVTEAKKYSVDILEEQNVKTENVRNISKNHIKEYKEISENVCKSYIACHQDASIEVVNLEAQRIENMKEIKVYNDFKEGLVKKEKMPDFIKVSTNLKQAKTIKKIAEKNKDDNALEKTNIEISNLKNQQDNILGENASAFNEVDARLECTLKENEELKESIGKMSNKMEEMENANLDLDKEEQIHEEVSQSSNKIAKVGMGIAKIALAGYIAKRVMGSKALEAFLVNKACKKLAFCSLKLEKQIIEGYIASKNINISKPKQYIKSSLSFIEGVKNNDKTLGFNENLSRGAKFGQLVAKDIKAKVKEKTKENILEKTLEKGEER